MLVKESEGLGSGNGWEMVWSLEPGAMGRREQSHLAPGPGVSAGVAARNPVAPVPADLSGDGKWSQCLWLRRAWREKWQDVKGSRRDRGP